jgi:ribonuclease HII
MIGVDEVGRGCWAGPLLVVAARPISVLPLGLTDSKLLSKKQREYFFRLLVSSVKFGEGWVSAAEIDQSGLGEAIRTGVSKALEALKAGKAEQIILDGSVNYCGEEFIKAKCVVKADQQVPIVSAASIYAKITRDKFMRELGLLHPSYGFEKHVGYGTKTHRDALLKEGVLAGIHRISYKPVGAFLSL